jgi:large subunit ribosomal protein L29
VKAVDLRDKDADELMQQEQDLRRELFNLRFQASTGELQNPKRINTVRKDIARILTIQAEKTESKVEKKDA